jgi:hypothetical protein
MLSDLLALFSVFGAALQAAKRVVTAADTRVKKRKLFIVARLLIF